MNPYHYILAAAWIVYYILHSVFAATVVKNRFRSLMGNRYKWYRLIYNIFNFLGLAAILIFQYSFPSPRLWNFAGLQIAGGVLFVLPGILIMFISIKNYFLLLSGIRTSKTESPELRVTGIHRLVRHPLYFGTILFVWGLFLVFPYLHNLVTVILLTAYVFIGLDFEEKKLVSEFGSQYRDYMAEVPKIIPRLRVK